MIENFDERLRHLKAEYAAHGVRACDAMSRDELWYLLFAKMSELDGASQRANRGDGTHVNVPLKLLLENDCRLISGALRGDQSKDEPGIDR